MEKKFIKKIGSKSQKWTIKIYNNIRKASEFLTTFSLNAFFVILTLKV